MKLDVQKNHLVVQILYRNLDPVKKRRLCPFDSRDQHGIWHIHFEEFKKKN